MKQQMIVFGVSSSGGLLMAFKSPFQSLKSCLTLSIFNSRKGSHQGRRGIILGLVCEHALFPFTWVYPCMPDRHSVMASACFLTPTSFCSNSLYPSICLEDMGQIMGLLYLDVLFFILKASSYSLTDQSRVLKRNLREVISH